MYKRAFLSAFDVEKQAMKESLVTNQFKIPYAILSYEVCLKMGVFKNLQDVTNHREYCEFD